VDLNSIFEKVLDYVIPIAVRQKYKQKCTVKQEIFTAFCVDKSFTFNLPKK